MSNKIFIASFLLLFSFFLMSPSCEKNETETIENLAIKTSEKPIKDKEMLDISYEKDYADLWRKVDSLQNIGLYKSGLDVVQTILDNAQKDGNSPQTVKAVIHKMKFNSYMTEDEMVVALAELNSITSKSVFPLKQIMHSITAETYWNYYENNRWKYINRTQTVNFENKDIRTWDLQKIFTHVRQHYLLSLSNEDSLQRASITDFKSILISTQNNDIQRPTLFDFLGHRAIDFFANTESGLTQPEDKFIMKGVDYFGSASVFIDIPITHKDTLSNQLFAVNTFQKLTSSHINDKNPASLIDLELKRLNFARNFSLEEKKDELYIVALNGLAEKYINHEGYSEIRFACASYFNRSGETYSNVNKQTSDLRWNKKTAIGICDEAIQRYPNSHGALQCEGLKKLILQKSITINSEMGYAPKSTGKLLINYKNVDSIYFKLIKVEPEFYLKTENYGEELIAELLKKSVTKSWSKKLQNPGDFQQHSTEIALDVPDFGQYALLASPDKEFKLAKNAIAYSSFWSTNISYKFRRNNEEEIDVIVADRETGKPLSNVKASIFIRNYNYVLRKYEIKKQENYTTDKDGMFIINSREEYRYIYVDFTQGNDRYNNSNQLYQYKPYKQDKTSYTTNFYTDRAIYRPGQTIHFKGICLKHVEGTPSIMPGKTTTVTLFDANSQKVASQQFTSNEYGTFSGTFTAPMGGLNGYMRISDANGSKYVSVEEYKRPKFEVEFEPVAGQFKIGEKITVKGIAKAFAGSVIDGAKVQYRITRSCNFPYWTYYRWGYYPYSPSTEIANGIIKTDENGLFTVEFVAKEDASIDKKYYPNYHYSISVDVTDVSGETRSASQWLVVGYNCMNLSLGIDGNIERSSKNRIKVSTTNLMGEKLSAKGTIEVTKLIEPEGVYRTSNWQKPDIQEFTIGEYRKIFPHDAFGDELDPTKYTKGESVLTLNFDTEKSDSVDLNGMKSWAPGRYIIESSSIDPFGESVKDVRYITILDKNSTKNPTSDVWTFIPLKDYCEPGDKAEFLISSAAENLIVLYEIELKGKIISKKMITLNQSQQLITIPIEEQHRGNITIHFSTTKYGRTYDNSHTISVPFTNKMLDVEFETFRNKLLPGSKEEWRIKIKGPKGEKVAAEMLAAMYDASLDEFVANSFYTYLFGSNYSNRYWESNCFWMNYSQLYEYNWNDYAYIPNRTYDHLNWWGYQNGYYNDYRNNYDYDGSYPMVSRSSSRYDNKEMAESEKRMEEQTISDVTTIGGIQSDAAFSTGTSGLKNEFANQQGLAANMPSGGDFDKRDGLSGIKARSNLSETAFFYPQLETNVEGEIILKFTMPEALTRWKFMAMAHTKDLKTGYLQDEVVTQKELMVTPNAPRFFREGDAMNFTAKISNLSEEDLSGTTQLLFFDAATMEPIDHLFKNENAVLDFEVKKGQSTAINWKIEVPFGIGAVTYRVVAKANNFTDGEEMVIPVLSNRMLVTESLPLPSKGIGTDNFTFTKLLNSGSSNSLSHHKLTLEYTSNPAWYAIQAMPYMMEYPYECSEQVFTRFYSNSLASNIINSNPKIKTVFETWKTSSPDAFLSNLEKNQELKSLMLEETPWVLDAQNESERKKRVGLLFDLNKMDNELNTAMRKLQKLQVSNGGWPWFPGMEESRYITQHIVTGMGHLDHLGVKNVREQKDVWQMVQKGVEYLDERIIEDYEWLKAHDSHYLTEQRVSQIHIQYLYARSYFKDIPFNDRLKEAIYYYQTQAADYWKNFNLYNEGMIALQAKRFEVNELPERILASIKERAIIHDELGMYWKDNVTGYYWYQAPIETQALLIEAFDEITNDMESVEDMKVWLLKQKQTTDWKTTKATAEACYALFLRGTELLSNDTPVEIKVNGELIDPKKLGSAVEAGTGYFKTSWSGDEIKPEMGNISVTRTTEGVSWGAMYWQYFEDLDKITPHDTPLKLNKKLFKVMYTNLGEVISPVTDTTKLHPGDKVRVRIELRTDRNMEYVHMKDMRAAGFEPTNVFSNYKWQDGLGYYESTKDAATNFFIEYLSIGTYVFEYDLRVNLTGDFSNGVTTIQCMYAPEFTSHSEGIRVNIEAEK